MIFSFLFPATNNAYETDKHHSSASHDPNHYSMEGSEFLDDALRMVDQPLNETMVEESERPGIFCG